MLVRMRLRGKYRGKYIAFCFWKEGFPKGGRGWGGPTFGKKSQKMFFFFLDSVPQSLVEGHLVEGELGQQLRHATEILIVEVDAALCSEPAPHWCKFEEAVSNLDGKMFLCWWVRDGGCTWCRVYCNWEFYTCYQTKCLSVQGWGILDIWNKHVWTAFKIPPIKNTNMLH